MLGDERGGHVAVVETAHLVGDDQRDRPADLGEMSEFGCAVARQAHHRHRPGAQQPEQRHRELAGIGQLHHHPVAFGDAEPCQPRGDPVRHGRQLGEGVRGRGVDDGGTVRPSCGGVGQNRIQWPARPVARLPVSLGTVLRKAHETRKQVSGGVSMWFALVS